MHRRGRGRRRRGASQAARAAKKRRAASISSCRISWPPSCQSILHIDALVAQPFLEALGVRHGTDRIPAPGRDQHPASRQTRLRLRVERDQRMHEHRRVEERRVLHHRDGDDVRAVGISDGEHALRAHALDLPCDEGRHALLLAMHVLHVVDLLRLAPEEAPELAVLHDVAARRDDVGRRRGRAGKVEDLVLVAAGAVEDEEKRRVRLAAPVFPEIIVGLLQHGCLPQSAIGSSDFSSVGRRCSCCVGSFSASPRRATSSSRSKPGSAVAISKSTPPGVRK